MEFFKVLTF